MSIGLKKKTETSALSALAFPGALMGIARGTLLDVQRISDDVLRASHVVMKV